MCARKQEVYPNYRGGVSAGSVDAMIQWVCSQEHFQKFINDIPLDSVSVSCKREQEVYHGHGVLDTAGAQGYRSLT